ncbi:MAG TPA: hypothetical protein VMD92_15635 [Acidobacteriaceae bacterium]|nr:hypothetical protein [Acidobacteriaceae bacterium]
MKLCLANVQTPENAWARATPILKMPLAFMTKEASKTDVPEIYIETIEESSWRGNSAAKTGGFARHGWLATCAAGS